MAQRKKGTAFDELRSLMKLQDSKLTVKSTGSQIKYNKAAGESEVRMTVAGIRPQGSGILAANSTQSTKKDAELRVPHDPVQKLKTDPSSTWMSMVLPNMQATEGVCAIDCHSVGADETATTQEEILFEYITNLLANETDERQTESNQQRKAYAPENEIGQTALKGEYLADEHGIGVRCDRCLPAAAEIILNTYTEDKGNILSELRDKPNTIVAGPTQELSEGGHEGTFDSADLFLELNLTAQMRDQDLHYGSEGIIEDAYKPVVPGTIANGLLDTNRGAPNLKETQERLVDHKISLNSDIQEGILFNPACAVNCEKLPTQDAVITAYTRKLTTQEAEPTDASDMPFETSGTEDETPEKKEGKKTMLTDRESQAPASSCTYTKNISQQKKCKLFRSKKSAKSMVPESFGTTMNNSESATKHSQNLPKILILMRLVNLTDLAERSKESV
ncbi:hypothetical protein BKA69DRAFT_728115 [Paraphysoderma sedebokerense]|nr:hypothetical protein BKA69DRAFT_728115 [Paraphysoderma sedebokerense]